MSEDLNFKIARDFIEMLKRKGITEVPFEDLTESLKKIAASVGYHEDDTIPVLKLEEYLEKTWGTTIKDLDANASVHQCINMHQGAECTSEQTASMHQVASTTDEDSDAKIISEISPWLEAIGKVVQISGSNQTEKKLAIYLLLKNKEMFDPDLRRELAPFGQYFSKRKEPYKEGTIRNVIGFIRNSPHIWSSKDPTTGMFIYRLKEETAKKIIETLQIILKEKEILEKQEAIKQANFEDLVRAAFEFLRDFYRDKVIDLFTVKAQDYLVVDWMFLNSLNPKLAEVVVEDPKQAIKAFEKAVQLFQVEVMFRKPEDVRQFGVHFNNVGFDVLRIKDLSSMYFGKMITVRGLVSGVTSKKKQFYSKMVVVCKDCGNEIVRLQDPIARVEFPTKCEACGSRNLMVDEKKSEVQDIIFFSLQDMVEDLGNKEQPSKVSAHMLNPHVYLSPGDRVLVTGILRDTVHKDRKQLSDMVLEVIHVEFMDDLGIGELSEEDIAEIRMLKERYGDELPNVVARSLAPNIFADPELLPELWFFKKAIVYAIASPKELGPGDERLWIHVLAVGDKGTGKSRIIRDIKNITVAVYGEGANVSGAGLIGMPEREELTGEWVFRGGLMVRANGFVLALDEFEKARHEDYARMHGGMSYGTVDFSKASISTTLKTMESVIAVANPIGGYFNTYKKVFEQITLPSSLLDRFDVIFILRQPNNPKIIEAIYDHQERFERGEITREIPEELLRKFFLYIRELKPEFTREAYQEIKHFGLMVNKALMNAGFKYSMRLRGILKRLSMANALLRLSEKVEFKDVLAAEEVFTASIRSWGDGDVDWSVFGEIEAQASREGLELLQKVEEAFEKLHEYYVRIPEHEVLDLLEEMSLDREKARYALEFAKERGMVVSEKGEWWLASRA